MYGSKRKSESKTVYQTVISFADIFNQRNVIADRINDTVFTDIDAMQFAILSFQQDRVFGIRIFHQMGLLNGGGGSESRNLQKRVEINLHRGLFLIPGYHTSNRGGTGK